MVDWLVTDARWMVVDTQGGFLFWRADFSPIFLTGSGIICYWTGRQIAFKEGCSRLAAFGPGKGRVSVQGIEESGEGIFHQFCFL
jgi:hypothetical protein